jgi:exopolysaccharide biosynthesis polyprenyl glycosylphosphotransferase
MRATNTTLTGFIPSDARRIRAQTGLKRGFDLIGGTALLVTLSPLLLVIALAVKLSSPGPAIFRQTRLGANGRPFTLLKFRTMTPNAAAFTQASRDDPRITPIGGFLRRTSLDELPQLINVIRGEMSLVGPRPHAPETEVEGMLFEAAVQSYHQRHQVKPGITGLAQIRGQRGPTPVVASLAQRLDSDLEYVESWSLSLDMLILLRTLPAILRQTNAY